jgi:hypothetical protein
VAPIHPEGSEHLGRRDDLLVTDRTPARRTAHVGTTQGVGNTIPALLGVAFRNKFHRCGRNPQVAEKALSYFKIC